MTKYEISCLTGLLALIPSNDKTQILETMDLYPETFEAAFVADMKEILGTPQGGE